MRKGCHKRKLAAPSILVPSLQFDSCRSEEGSRFIGKALNPGTREPSDPSLSLAIPVPEFNLLAFPLSSLTFYLSHFTSYNLPFTIHHVVWTLHPRNMDCRNATPLM